MLPKSAVRRNKSGVSRLSASLSGHLLSATCSHHLLSVSLSLSITISSWSLSLSIKSQPDSIRRNKSRKLQEEGTSVALRSCGDNLTHEISIYVVDSLGELRDFYNLTPIAVVGGSFLPGSAGHNILEAAAAGCAVFTGHYMAIDIVSLTIKNILKRRLLKFVLSGQTV